MNWVEKKLKIWKNYGYEDENIRRFDFALAERNTQALISCLCLVIPIFVLLIVVRIILMGVREANILPMILAVLIFVYLLNSARVFLKTRIRLEEHAHILIQIFVWTVYGLAIYYDIMMRQQEINGMLCVIFIGMGLVFDAYPESYLKIAIRAYVLTVIVELLYEHGEIRVINLTNSFIAMTTGLYVSWKQSHTRFELLIYKANEGSVNEQKVRTQMMLTQIRPE